MPAPVNLNRYRKAKNRTDASVQADENAIRHGRTKAQKQLERSHEKKHIDAVEQHEIKP